MSRPRTSTDANRILDAWYDPDGPEIVASAATRAKLYHFPFPETCLGRQLAEATWAQLPHAQRGGNWTSRRTLSGGCKGLLTLHDQLVESGCDDISKLEMPLYNELRNAWHQGGPRGFDSKFKKVIVAAILNSEHPAAERVAKSITYQQSSANRSAPVPSYDEATAAAIEHYARNVLRRFRDRQRELLKAVGIDTSGDEWILLTANEIAEQLPEAPERISRSRLRGPSLPEQVAYAMQHGVAPTTDESKRINAALWPSAHTLRCALVVLCLAENRGENVSTMLTLTDRSVIRTGAESVMVHSEKARSATEYTVVESTSRPWSHGGVVTTMVGLSRFSLAYRQRQVAQLVDPSPQLVDLAHLLFAPHRANVQKLSLLETHIGNGKTGHAFEQACGEVPQFRRLRMTALARQTRAHGAQKARISGQSEGTRRRYLEGVLPPKLLRDALVQSQDEFVEHARAYLRAELASTSRSEGTGPGALAGDMDGLDVATTTCVTNGNDPDSDAPCARGLLGCFQCPSAKRTAANIPGLQAAVDFTDKLKSRHPNEFYAGEAETLQLYSEAALSLFSPEVVRAAEEPEATKALVPLVAWLYYHDLRGPQ